MTVSSFTVIAIDNNGQEHELEQKGHHRRDAVQNLLKSEKGKTVIEVLNGNKHKDFRKSIWLRPGCESRSPDPLPTESTSLGLAFGEAVSCQGREAARLILKDFENRGIKLGLFDEDGDQPTIVYPRGLTDEDKTTIAENSDSLIAALRANITKKDDEKPKRKTQRDILRAILADPELKTAFQRYDVELLLRRSGHHVLADDETKLDALLAWAAQGGLIERTTRGNYRKVAVASELPPPPSEATDQPTQEPPTQHTEPDVPQPPELAEPPLVATQPSPPVVEPRGKPVETPQASSLQAVPVQEALIQLAADLGAGSIDELTIDQAQKAVNDMTNALAFFETLLQRARRINTSKSQLLQRFGGIQAG